MSLRLEMPSLKLKASYLDALRDGHVCGNASPKSPGQIQEIETDFSSYLASLNSQGQTVTFPNGEKGPEVPYQRLWATDDSQRFLGETIIRHTLNNFYNQQRGHISYGVPPAARGQGIASQILKVDLSLLNGLGVSQALLTCSITNSASLKVIRSAGGKVIDVKRFPWKQSPLTCRFAVPTKGSP